jgi:hypothetical protein
MQKPSEARTKLANNIQNKNKYQGWWNAQTWCVALTLNNSKYLQDYAFNIFRRHNLSDAKIELKNLCNRNAKEIFYMAPWVWGDRFQYGFSFDSVNWTELALHFTDKLEEIWRTKN